MDKAISRIEKGANVLWKIQQGCMFVLINLFLCGFFSWGVFAASNAVRLESQETGSARVIELNEINDPELGRRYTSIVEYQVNGRTYTAEVGEPSIPAEHELGETVAIRYPLENPQAATLDDWVERWLFPLIIIPAMAIAAVVINFLVFRAWRRGDDAEVLDMDL